MGQKLSATEDSGGNSTPTKRDSLEFRTKPKKSLRSSDVKPDSPRTRKGSFADAERLESGDAPTVPPTPENEVEAENNAVDAAIRERFEEEEEEEKNVDEDSRSSTKVGSKSPATVNSNIVQLGQLTALRMMQNFKGIQEKAISQEADDGARSERPGREIASGDAKEVAGSATAIKDGDDEDELLRLRERLDRLERERDEARTRLRIVEDRCQAYENESKCLDASLDSLEEKLRDIMRQLGDEMQRSQDLEHHLTKMTRRGYEEEPAQSWQRIGGTK